MSGDTRLAAFAAAEFLRDDIIAQLRLAFIIRRADKVGVAEEREHLVQVVLQELGEAFVIGVRLHRVDEVAEFSGEARGDPLQPDRDEFLGEVTITRGQAPL